MAAAKTPSSQKTTGRATGAPPRKLKKPTYSSFRLQKRVKHVAPPLIGGFRLFWQSVGFLLKRWKLFGGIVAVYGLLQVALVQGFNSAHDVSSIKQISDSLTEGHVNQLMSSLTSFGYLLGTTGASGAYQTIVALITSLALIWAIRQVYGGQLPRIRDAFYKGVYPLVQFVLVLVVVALQSLPTVLVITLFSFANANEIIQGNLEHLLWILLTIAAVLLSLYMLCSSLFALYIVTLPDMTPLRALRSARELVRFRRWSVMRRIILLPIMLVLAAGIIMVPLIMLATAASGYVFVLLSLSGVAIIHSYMYHLYKELLQ